MANRTISAKGIALIKRFEGCRLTAYKCSAGVWTIGYGHTSGVHSGQVITQAQADAYLRKDLEKFEKYVNDPAYVPITAQLNDNQFAALVSFTFNCGQGNLKRLCADRNATQIAAAMPQYCKAAGRKLPGLVLRRAAEVDLFNTPVTTTFTNQPTVKVAEVQHVQPNYQPGQAYFVHVDNLRIRSKPSTQGKIIGKIGNRAVCNRATTRDSKGQIWMNISGSAKEEWICADTGVKSFVY